MILDMWCKCPIDDEVWLQTYSSAELSQFSVLGNIEAKAASAA
jgi:hypothetical protein